jgi:hypothetical protein
MPRWSIFAVTLACFLSWRPEAAEAIPLFAHQYGVTCQKCHSVIPHLNEFGAAFLANGERLPGVQAGPAFPLSAKTNVLASTANQGSGPNGAGLPKWIVDEIELFTTSTIGSRANYFVEQYVVDGGEDGLLRDAWINDRVNPWEARIGVYLQGGSFTLPLPVDPETFRDSYQDYAPYVQTVGANPFNFFDPKMGMRLGVGNPLHGFNVQLFAGPGYDRESELSKTGVDTEVYVQDLMGPFALSVFHYDGLRPIDDEPFDRFERTGYGFTYGQWTRFSSEFVLLEGWDSNCGIPGHTGCASSGGFEQLRYAFNRKLYAEARYEGTNAPTGFERDGVVMMGYGPTENTRLTLEDVVSQQTHPSNTMNVQATIGY